MRENITHPFISFIFIIKILFIIFASIHYYLIITHSHNTSLSQNIVYWKERLEFIFMVSMAILTIVLFRPFNNKPIMIGTEERFLFFVYGIITFITARWSAFVHQAKWFTTLQYALGRSNIDIQNIIRNK
jgi:hypothetical protein